MLNRELISFVISEGIEEKSAVDFLSSQIKGSPFHGKVYLAGGYVRDELLGLDPKDIDVVVELPEGGIKFAEWLTKKLGIYRRNSNPVVYPKFGTAKFNLRGITHNGVDLSSIDIECVMTRKEQYHTGSRKPDVTPGSLRDDVERRDFTVNSLLKDLTTGEILDLTGKGKEDIKKGVVQTPLDPDIIFREDPLRMLRAIRFAVKYNWKLPMFMIRGLKKNSAMIKNISAERINAELSKMIVTSNPDKAIRLLQITGLSGYVMPELDKLVGLKQNKFHEWDAMKHTLLVLKNVKPALITRLAALFHDIGKPSSKQVIDNEIHFYDHEEVSADIAEDIMRRLKYPNDIIAAVTTAVRNHMRLKQSGLEGEKISDKSLRKLQRELGDHLENTLELMQADNLAHGRADMPKQIPGIKSRLSSLQSKTPSKVKLPINGSDIQSMLGLPPGKIIGQLLAVVQDAVDDNPHLTRSQASDLVKAAYKKIK